MWKSANSYTKEENIMTSESTQLLDDVFEGAVPNQEDYPDTLPTLLPEGKYLLKIVKAGWQKDKEGKVVKPNNPTFVLEDCEVLTPQEAAGKHVRFLRFTTTTFERNGQRASAFGDLMRALDKDFDWQNKPSMAADFIQRCIETGEPFLVRLRWEAFDIDHWKDMDGSNLPKDEQKILAKETRLSGMKNFPPDGKGGFIPEWVGPSGATVEARLGVGQVFRSDKKKG